jgi:hypothetical protein
MDLIELLDSDVLVLPKSQDAFSGSFDQFVADMLDAYLVMLGKITATDYLSGNVVAGASSAIMLCDAIKRCLAEYLLGHPAKAYGILAAALNKVRAHLDNMCTVNIAKQMSHLYRMRSDLRNSLTPPELFHVCFELRHLVATARYSIPGLPCLYLGGSAYLCWKEIGMPNLDSLHVSRFQALATVDFKVLDFGWRPAQMAALIHSGKYSTNLSHSSPASDLLTAQVICWPILAACSIKVKNLAPFKPEYVIPQLVLQWLTAETKMDGVRYFSTQIKPYANDPASVANFVFPARKIKPTGHCSLLASKFELCDPVHWATAKLTAPATSTAPHMNFEIEDSSGTMVPYTSSELGRMQHCLAGLKCKPL